MTTGVITLSASSSVIVNDSGRQISCPVCDGTSREKYALPAARIRAALESYYDEKLPENLIIADTSLHRCESCTLEHAVPPEPGDATFYEWITAHRTYYPAERWEWPVVRDMLIRAGRAQSLLEIGCGDGRFLEMLRDVPALRACGLDTTASSVAKCRARGLDAREETIEDHLRRMPENAGRFDVVAAFHCLEHVADPAGLVSEALALLAPQGRLLISTPYSPMSFETLWFDPLNHPPHHMTRWNVTSYRALAKRFALDVRFHMPAAPSVLHRVAMTLNLLRNGPAHLMPARRVLAASLLRPARLLGECLRQWRRERVNGQPAADVVLAEFTRR